MLARQFIKMTRMELEEHIVNFSRNIDTCKDTTHIEAEKVRYLFIPIENLYLVLITSKNSNIIDDIEIIKLVYRLLQDICGTISEDEIKSNAYELMLGMDDLVSLGFREGVTIGQVKQYLEMESLDEKEWRKAQEQKEAKQKKELKARSDELDRHRREARYMPEAISNVNFESPIRIGGNVEITSISAPANEEPVVTKNTTNKKKVPSKGLKLSKKKAEEQEENEEN